MGQRRSIWVTVDNIPINTRTNRTNPYYTPYLSDVVLGSSRQDTGRVAVPKLDGVAREVAG